MIPHLCPLITALAQLGLRHSTIAHSLGLTLPTLRQFFARELLQAAADAEIATLASSKRNPVILSRLKTRPPPPPKPPQNPVTPPDSEKGFTFTVYNNDHEPNFPL